MSIMSLIYMERFFILFFCFFFHMWSIKIRLRINVDYLTLPHLSDGCVAVKSDTEFFLEFIDFIFRWWPWCLCARNLSCLLNLKVTQFFNIWLYMGKERECGTCIKQKRFFVQTHARLSVCQSFSMSMEQLIHNVYKPHNFWH